MTLMRLFHLSQGEPFSRLISSIHIHIAFTNVGFAAKGWNQTVARKMENSNILLNINNCEKL